ncbi:hypothetical protein GBA52_025041 [Prunus armeniaca]|nr:hypothetical protein GBA52_025041 [Prunus armeniaca]
MFILLGTTTVSLNIGHPAKILNLILTLAVTSLGSSVMLLVQVAPRCGYDQKYFGPVTPATAERNAAHVDQQNLCLMERLPV